MQYHECDQIGNDLFVAAKAVSERFGEPCDFDLGIGEILVEKVAWEQRTKPLTHAIELALDAYPSLTYVQKEAYRLALKKIIGRRKGAARAERIRSYQANDFPRGQKC
jgi:hypothetical protein